MRPLKASLLFVYCLAAIAAVGTAVSHLWTTTKDFRDDSLRHAASAPLPAAPAADEPAAPAAPAAPAPQTAPAAAAQPS
jgi:hypothetical protein